MLSSAQAAADLPALSKVNEVLATLLLPCLALIPGQVALAHEVWEMLRVLPAETRYRIYTDYKVRTDGRMA